MLLSKVLMSISKQCPRYGGAFKMIMIIMFRFFV